MWGGGAGGQAVFRSPPHSRRPPRPYIMEHIFFIILNLYLKLFVIVMTVGGENDDKNLPVIYSIDQAMFLGNLT